jgi:hypothetical protein
MKVFWVGSSAAADVSAEGGNEVRRTRESISFGFPDAAGQNGWNGCADARFESAFYVST